jgi:hypothetical protein
MNYREGQSRYARLAMLAAGWLACSELFDRKIATFSAWIRHDASDRAPSVYPQRRPWQDPVYWVCRPSPRRRPSQSTASQVQEEQSGLLPG